MADYFTNFSMDLSLPTEEAQQYALNLAEQAFHIHMGDEVPDDFPKSLIDVAEDWQFEVEAEQTPTSYGLWMHSQHGGIDAICAFIQHLLQRFDPKGCATLEWSHDCSKPRTDAYGGGAAIITAKRIRTISTGVWIQRQLHRHNNRR
ncbi:MAG: hypothetical protein ABMA13_00805 [Chthoniobacteraceae bacterium]